MIWYHVSPYAVQITIGGEERAVYGNQRMEHRNTTPPHVTLVLNSLRSGGAEKQLLWIAREIREFGWGCSIIELTRGERTDRIERMIRSADASGVIVAHAPAGAGLLGNFIRLRRHLKQYRPKLVWSWGRRADLMCFLAAVWRRRQKWLVSVRSANLGLKRSSIWLERLIAVYCHGVVSNTHAGLRTSGLGHSATLTRWVLPNAVTGDKQPAIALSSTRPQRLVLVMLGNIRVRTKGYDIAAHVARALADRGLPFELRIAGRPDEMECLQDIVRRLRIEQQVRYCGEASAPERFLREGHLFLLLSRFEGMPNTLLEALHVGLPAIATDVGDLRALKNQGAPFELIPIEDVAAAESAILKAWNHWEETAARARCGPTWIEAHFSEDHCRAVLRRIFAEACIL